MDTSAGSKCGTSQPRTQYYLRAPQLLKSQRDPRSHCATTTPISSITNDCTAMSTLALQIDQVIIHTPTRQGKLASQWIGPAVVINKHSDLLYRVRFPDTNKTAVVHVRRLARYHPNPHASAPTSTSTGRRLRSKRSSGVGPRVPRSEEEKHALCNRRVRKFFGKSAYLGRVAHTSSNRRMKSTV